MPFSALHIQHLIVIDPRVDGWQDLIADVDPSVGTLLLDRDADGLAQIVEHLESLKDPVESVQVLSHGAPGHLFIGSTDLCLENIESRQLHLAQIGKQFGVLGEILLYGCEVAQGARGRAFVERLGALTNVYVGASSTKTGAAKLGGNWLLEFSTGPVRSGMALNAGGMQRYEGVLDGGTPPPTLTQEDINTILDGVPNIAQLIAEALPGSDFIPGMKDLVTNELVQLLVINALKELAPVVTTGPGVYQIDWALGDGVHLGFSVSTDIVSKLKGGQSDYIFAIDINYELPEGKFSNLFKDTPFENLLPDDAELVVLRPFAEGSLKVEPIYDEIFSDYYLSKGVSLIATYQLEGSSLLNDPVINFLHNRLGVEYFQGTINAAPSQFSLGGRVKIDKELFHLDEFHLKLDTLSLAYENKISEGTPEYSLSYKQALTLIGFDPTQANEPDLKLSSGYTISGGEIPVITIFGAINTLSEDANVAEWNNPFGLKDATIREVGLQVGLQGGALSNLGIILDGEFGNLDFSAVALVDIADSEKNAFALTLNQPMNLVEFWAKSNSAVFGEVGQKVVEYASPIFSALPLIVESVDSNGDGKLDPLISYVPSGAVVAGTIIEPGYSINARASLFGAEGELIVLGQWVEEK